MGGAGLGRTFLLQARLGSRGFEVSRVGLGAWAMGGGGWYFSLGEQDDRDSEATIRQASELGVNWIDTAAVYGCGHSEEVVGRALKRLPPASRPLVFTKGGYRCDPKDPRKPPIHELSPQSIRRDLEGSLKRLQMEAIDLYQIHWPHPGGVPVEETWGEMARLAEEGKIRYCGVSNFDVNLLSRIEPIRHVDSLQPPFSLIEREAAEGLLPWARAHGCGIIVYSPLASGLLASPPAESRRKAQDPRDWRSKAGNYAGGRLARNFDLALRLRGLADAIGVSLPELAIAWTLAWPGVTGAIVGARNPVQLEGWVKAPEVRLDGAVLDEIAAAIEASGAGTGPTRPPDP